ncbi:hypothetical protein QUN99_003329 [Vibrio parahaemolyticus]|nr:hypothetical protein [Vibrio parahaemolyticus]
MQFRSVRYKHHYGNVLVTAEGKTDTVSITGASVAALLKNGHQQRKAFGGFVDAERLSGLQRIKLLDITALYEDELGFGEGYLIPRHHYVVGAYLNDTFCILLYNGLPKHYPLPEIPPKELASVTRIH